MNDGSTTVVVEDELALLQAHASRLEQRLQERETASAALLLQAELKLEAMRAGMIDLDGLKMIDPARLTVGPAGEAVGVAQLMASLRRDKPWLFSAATSSSAASAPPSSPPRRKLATEMTMEEWRLARADLLRRR